jgi:hypothetical protein
MQTLTALSDPGHYAVFLALIETGSRNLWHLWTFVESVAAAPGTQVLGWAGALLWRLGLRLGKRGGRKRKVRITTGFGITQAEVPV